MRGYAQRLATKRSSHENLAYANRENRMTLGTVLLIVLILMLVGAFPSWPHSSKWGYGPTGGVGLVLVIVIVLLLTGRI